MVREQLSLFARPGCRDELVATLDRVEVAATADDVDRGTVELHVPVDDPDRVLVVSMWPSAEHYERWLLGRAWETIYEAIEPLLAEEPETHVYRLVDSIG
jgi:quinol monooxygenase YgiN